MLTSVNMPVGAPRALVMAVPVPAAPTAPKSRATATLRVPSTRQRQKPQVISPVPQFWPAAVVPPLSNTRVRVNVAPSGASAVMSEWAMVPV